MGRRRTLMASASDGAVALTTPTLAFFAGADQTIDPIASRQILKDLASKPPQIESVQPDPIGDNHVLAGDIMSPGTTQQEATAMSLPAIRD